MKRHDLYAPIHKGLRLALSDLLVRLGRADFADAAATAGLLAALRRQLVLSAGHLHHEEVEIHTVLEARAPGSTLTLEADHDHHRRAFVTLEAAIAAVEAAPPAERAAPARELYLAFSQFVAADFAHMAEEELTTLLPAVTADQPMSQPAHGGGVDGQDMAHGFHGHDDPTEPNTAVRLGRKWLSPTTFSWWPQALAG